MYRNDLKDMGQCRVMEHIQNCSAQASWAKVPISMLYNTMAL